jgi:hypothetical protein
VDLVVSPTVVTLNTQSGSGKPVLTPGQLIDALVLQFIDATTVRLAVGDSIIDVKIDAKTDVKVGVPLEPGVHVRLAARGYGDDIHWVIVGAGVGTAASGTSGTKLGTPTPPHPAGPATEVTISTGTTPGANTAAGTSTTPTDIDPLLSAQSAKPDTAQPLQRTPPVEANPAAEVIDATRSAAARQGSLAPVFAELSALAAAPDLPPPLQQIIRQVLAMPVKLDVASGENLRQAVSKSGLFLEARFAGDDNMAAQAPVGDLKAALLVLRQNLQVWVETLSETPQVDTPVKAEIANAPAQLQTDIKAPPPPYRGALTTGQQPIVVEHFEQFAPAEIARTLIAQTDSAIARQVLMQVASLPDTPSVVPSHSDGADTHWNLEIPFVTPQGTAVAHFEIARDGHRASTQEAIAPAWRANFSLDVEPMGPVHAQIALTGKRAAVRIWAERTATGTALRAGISDLTAALRAAALDAGDIVVRDGAPPRPLKPNPGRFLDRAS